MRARERERESERGCREGVASRSGLRRVGILGASEGGLAASPLTPHTTWRDSPLGETKTRTRVRATSMLFTTVMTTKCLAQLQIPINWLNKRYNSPMKRFIPQLARQPALQVRLDQQCIIDAPVDHHVHKPLYGAPGLH
jgi:hypothetical protein